MTDRIRGAGGRPAGVQATPARTLDWATAATEARRRRDDAVKQKIEELRQQRQQARAAVDATQEISRTRKV
jgi:hypothetical protein